MSQTPVAIDDLFRIRLVADPNISPDGTRVAYVVTTVDRDANSYRSAIWLVDVEPDSEPRRFTSGACKDASPRWSPDGTLLAFLSDRSGKGQVHVMHADGGESWQASSSPNAATEFVWSPDSSSILFVSKVDKDVPEGPKSDVRHVTALRYKLDGEGFLDGKRRHVFQVSATGGEARQLTDGDWDSTQPALSPDGRCLAVVSNRSENRENNSLTDIWLADLRDRSTRRITPEDGNYATPAWSPDGSSLAYTGHPIVAPHGPSTLDDLYVWRAATGETSRLLTSLDREPGNSAMSDMRYALPEPAPVWDASGEKVLTLVSDRGSVHVYACGLDGEPEPLLNGARDIQSFTVSRNGMLAFSSSTLDTPTEAFVRAANGVETRLSGHNDEFMAGVALGSVEEITFESDPGVQIHGWLLKPPSFNDEQRYPAIVQVHGGPHGMYGTGFFHEMHVLAARGYVILFANPRGSTGYGQSFVSGSMGDWGGADFRDVMAGADLLEALPYVDPTRIGVTGGSYGGYIVNWAIGQTDRFRAAVTQRSTCNRLSLYGVSDFNMMYNDWEFRGNPYDNVAYYLERSPLTYVKNVTTPLLILHSENDLRCPISQAEELFVALKTLGKTVEFVRFPDESHGLSRTGQPLHRIERLERLCGWFDRYL
ncbi:MAG TPA: S9 family peptidase [Thermomicrobiales bacterium]|nr:S9 family peptidase [Thermomicrobiales bacterium]